MQWVIKDWITNLTVIAILGALVDIILPNGSFRKYTGFIFGLVLLVMILQPLLQVVGQFQEVGKTILQNSLVLDVEAITYQSNYLEDTQKQQLENTFKKNLESSITSQLDRTVGLANISTSITFKQNKSGVDLTAIEKLEIQADSTDRSVYIEPIEINPDSNTAPRSQKRLDKDKVLEIKKYISELYELQEDIIFVNGE